MRPMADYHALFRAALVGKRRLGRRTALTDDQATRLAVELGAMAGLTLDVTFAYSLAHPPGGRLAPLVLARLAEQYGIPATVLEQRLFGERRARSTPAFSELK